MVQRHIYAWALAGGCSVFATLLASVHIAMHLRNYNNPRQQRLIIRIMLMVPIYAIDSWLSLRFKGAALYLDTVRDCYEAYVVFNFFVLLMEYIGPDQLERVLRNKPALAHPWPFRYCFPPMAVSQPSFLRWCKVGTLQFVLVKPAMGLLAMVCDALGVYDEGAIFNPRRGYLYVTLINNFAVSTAMYALVAFYLATADELKPSSPKSKFLCIKAVLFFSFWQSVVIALLAKVNVIHDVGSWTSEDVATGLQDFLVCVEMALASMAHWWSFSYEPYVLASRVRTPLLPSVMHSASVKDIVDETRTTFIQPIGRALVLNSRAGLAPAPAPALAPARAASLNAAPDEPEL